MGWFGKYDDYYFKVSTPEWIKNINAEKLDIFWNQSTKALNKKN